MPVSQKTAKQIKSLTPTQIKAVQLAKTHNVTPKQLKTLHTLKGGAVNPATIDAAVKLAPEVNKAINSTLDFTKAVLQDPTRVRNATLRQDRHDERARAAQARAERNRAETDRRRKEAYDRKMAIRADKDAARAARRRR